MKLEFIAPCTARTVLQARCLLLTVRSFKRLTTRWAQVFPTRTQAIRAGGHVECQVQGISRGDSGEVGCLIASVLLGSAYCVFASDGLDRSIDLSIYLSIYLSLSIHLSISICLSIYLSVSRSIYLFACLSIFLSIHLSIYLFIYIYVHRYIIYTTYMYMCVCVYVNMYIHQSISLSLPPSLPPSPLSFLSVAVLMLWRDVRRLRSMRLAVLPSLRHCRQKR